MQVLPIKSELAPPSRTTPLFPTVIRNLKNESVQLADPKMTRALVALMDMYAVLGGAASHFGGPAAFADLMSAIHGFVFLEAEKQKKDWFQLFHLINDAGHCENGLYALKAAYGFPKLKLEDLKKFRSIDSPLCGHGESHLFPEGVYLSNGPLGSALPQSQGLAMADARLGLNRVTVTAISDGACMEGEAREALASIPGFAERGLMAPFILVISDNNTKLSGRIDQDSFSMNPTFAAVAALGWKKLDLADGHNLQSCYQTFETAVELVRHNPKQPVVIHAKTIKGFGTKQTAQSSSGAHGFPLKSPKELKMFLQEILGNTAMPEFFENWIAELNEIEKNQKKEPSLLGPEDKIQVGISQSLIELRESGLPIVSLTSDLPGSTGLAAFQKKFPADTFDVGVAESNMISVAAGFSKAGFIPVVDTFSQFGVTKGALPLTMAQLSQAPMICVFSHTGFQDAADGASHQALTYLSMLQSIPNIQVFALTCASEAKDLMGQVGQQFAHDVRNSKVPKTSVFFLGRENFPLKYVDEPVYKAGKSQTVFSQALSPEKTVAIVAAGSMLYEGYKAAQKLSAKGYGVVLVNPSCLNLLDIQGLSQAFEKANYKVITVEDHQKLGGFGEHLAATFAQLGHPIKIQILGVNGTFGQSAYKSSELYKLHGLDCESICLAAEKILTGI